MQTFFYNKISEYILYTWESSGITGQIDHVCDTDSVYTSTRRAVASLRAFHVLFKILWIRNIINCDANVKKHTAYIKKLGTLVLFDHEKRGSVETGQTKILLAVILIINTYKVF